MSYLSGGSDFQREDIKTLHIMPGLYCNFFCSHCVNDSGTKQTLKITDGEIQQVIKTIKDNQPKLLQFTGGEPTFYIEEINKVLKEHPCLDECKVQVTTNGWFGESQEKVEETLSKLVKLDSVLLSFDKFHSSRFSEDRIQHIRDYCAHKKIDFCISMCITSPTEGLEAKRILGKYNCQIILQKVDASGRAGKNNLYYHYPTFEEEVLNRKCPNLDTVSYVAGFGHSICCGNLLFNSKYAKGNYSHESLKEHIESDFYKAMKNLTFGELLKNKGIDPSCLESKHSSACSLCEFIWKEA